MFLLQFLFKEEHIHVGGFITYCKIDRCALGLECWSLYILNKITNCNNVPLASAVWIVEF